MSQTVEQSTTRARSKTKVPLTSQERQTSTKLALLFAVRMLGLFLLTPVFADAAKQLAGGNNVAWIGIAMGAYGVTQAMMQIPFGVLSDKFGRRPIIMVGMLLFVIGGIICALSDSVWGVALGRAIQGFGAVSAAITAWVADATRPEVRARAMAMVGGSIGLSFAVSLLVAPLLVDYLGLQGLFWVISLLGFACLLLATFFVPSAPIQDQAMTKTPVSVVLKNESLLRLNFGVFCLHFVLMALFVVLPSSLVSLGGLTLGELWKVYFPVIVLALVFMVPAIIYIETRYQHKAGLFWSVFSLMLLLLVWTKASQSFWATVIALFLFFVIFNVLEALQPSVVSRVTPPEHKGLALGIYNMCQALGVAAGAAVGGVLVQYGQTNQVFLLSAVLLAIWAFIVSRLSPIQG